MKRSQVPILIALLVAAVPIEVVNLLYATPPLDVDSVVPDNFYAQFLSVEWLVLHLPTLRVLGWVEERTSFRPQFAAVLFIGGYLSTALLLILMFLGFLWLRSLAAKYSASAPNAAP
jgi:hypothetical protein